MSKMLPVLLTVEVEDVAALLLPSLPCRSSDVRATVYLGDVALYTGFYRQAGPERLNEAASFALDHVARRLADLIRGEER